MADARTHMHDDLAAVLADPDGAAVEVVLDGAPVRAFVEDLELSGADFEGGILAQKKLTLLHGSVAAFVPGEPVDMDGLRYVVHSFLSPYPAHELVLTRFSA